MIGIVVKDPLNWGMVAGSFLERGEGVRSVAVVWVF